MSEIVLEIAACLVTLFCFVDSIKNRSKLYLPFPKGWVNKLKNQHTIYLVLLLALSISAVFSVLDLVLEKYVAHRNLYVLYAVNECYFIFHTALSFLFAMYVINFTGFLKKKGKLFFAFFLIPIDICYILILTNPLTKYVFYINADKCYTRGDLLWVIYAGSAFYILVGIIAFCVNRDILTIHDRVAMTVLMFISVIGIVIQGAFDIPVELFFEAIAFLGFMLLIEDRQYKDKTGKNATKSNGFILVIACCFLIVIAMNVSVIYHSGSDQTGKIGEIQLNNLKGEMQQTMSDAESHLLRYAMGLEQVMSNTSDVKAYEKYIYKQNDYYNDLSGGNCFSVYAACEDWCIIPNFDYPEEYHAVERVWYKGAKNIPKETYISDPYIDADTGNLCYTFSYLLSDGVTVVAMDYTMSTVQDIVERMSASKDQYAMIVADDGTIVGCTDIEYQGKDLLGVMPEYKDVYERVKASNNHKSFKTTIDSKDKIIFSSEMSNGWKLILAVDYSTFYKEIINSMILLGAIDLLMVAVIIVFYMVSVNNQERAESTLNATEDFITSISDELMEPLNEILMISDSTYKNTDDAVAFKDISFAGNRLKEKMNNLFSYSNILKDESSVNVNDSAKKNKESTVSGRHVKSGVIVILIAALLVGLFMCLSVTTKWGEARIKQEASVYEGEVATWISQKQTILSMFSDVIAADPTLLDDYDAAVKWLDDIAKNYSDITFAYMANPYNKEHAIIMNNGWVPEPDYKVEERQWYIDTERSGTGYSISAPYFDAQTGLYCVTFSRCVYTKDGNFIGIFAIDCLLDKLVDVLDDSYTSNSYAFMVDRDGTIINHPDKDYEISSEKSVNIEDTEYADVYHKGSVFRMNDYAGKISAAYASKGDQSEFTVIVIQSWWSIYGPVLLVVFVFLFMLILSIIIVANMINKFTRWQEETNEKLVTAVDNAVAAEKAKSRFLAQMSHEIRTPINAVLGMNEMILRESKDNDILEYAGNVRSAGSNLLGLINSILDFSKIEEGKMEIIPVKYESVDMIRSVINSIAKRAADKGLDFEAHVDPNLPITLYGDDMRVSQVIINLLTNAVKYTKEGRVDLYVDFAKTDTDAIILKIRVKDTGIGIKEEDIGRLFDSFTRLEETKNRNIEGTGLGMAIVNRLLDMMGSKLAVESVYGEGSEFSFEVKQDVIDAEPIGDYEARVKESYNDQDDTYLYAPDARVLVVDDYEMNLNVIKNLLKLNGIEPDVAMSGAEALKLMAENDYDIVMLDHMMPEMDGIETLEKAKEDGLIRSSAVIALTANAVIGARETYIEAGFDDYLSKPIEVRLLEDILGKYLPKGLVEYKSKTDDISDNTNVEPVGNASKETSSDEGSGGLSILESEGIDTKTGLMYCAGNEDFYKQMLSQYLSTADDRINELNELLNNDDLKNYSIKIHALKSGSKTIGAKELSELAKDLELKSKADDKEAVAAGHPKFIEEYNKILDCIGKTL